MDAWNADTSFTFRREVLISALFNDVVLDVADEDNTEGWRHNGDWHHRAAVADAGSAAKNIQRMREVSLPLARDPDPRVRAAAYAAIAPYADSAEGAPLAARVPVSAAHRLGPGRPLDRDRRAHRFGHGGGGGARAQGLRALGRRFAERRPRRDRELPPVGVGARQRPLRRLAPRARSARFPLPPDQATRDAARGFALLAAWETRGPDPGARARLVRGRRAHARRFPRSAGSRRARRSRPSAVRSPSN